MKHEETARRLRFALEQKGMIAQELADLTGIHKSSISQYVNGSHAPGNRSAGAMAAVLDVSPVWLMGYDVPMRAEKHPGEMGQMEERRSINLRELSALCSDLSEDAQRRLVEYAKKLRELEEMERI